MIRDILFVVFVLSCIWIVLKGLSKYQVPVTKFLIIVSIWTLLLTGLSISGFLNNFNSFPPKMMLVLVVPMLLIIWFTLSSASNHFLSSMPASWIVKMQSFRIVVELFIWWGFIDKIIPVQMTFEGLNFDILVGLTAPIAAFWWLKDGHIKPAAILIWNILGLILLFNIVIIAVLSMPTPKQYFFNEPANTVVATFPWVLLPGILVMLAFGLHLLSIKQMVRLMKNDSKHST